MLKLFRPFEEEMLKLWKPLEEPIWNWKPELPMVHVREEEAEYLVEAEVPGFAPEDVKVTLEGDILTIEGKHEEKKEEEGRKLHRRGEFRRLFRLPEGVAADAIEAKMADGLLKLVLPKVEVAEREVKTIEVEKAPKAVKAAKPKKGAKAA